MPNINLGPKTGEGEGVAGAGGGGLTGEVGRVTQNQLLAEHVGKFIAGELQTKFRSENLAEKLKGANMIHVSFSWG
jgi:hypothetical protein